MITVSLLPDPQALCHHISPQRKLSEPEVYLCIEISQISTRYYRILSRNM